MKIIGRSAGEYSDFRDLLHLMIVFGRWIDPPELVKEMLVTRNTCGKNHVFLQN